MTLPDPLTPADCDLRGLEYMPLLGQRLFGSEFNAMASDSEWRAALTLWWAAWTQCPAGSLPDDDVALCRLADLGRDVKGWRKLRDRALHGFVKCSDGRLYHPTLAQQALVAWDKRQQDRSARSGDAERKAKERAARAAMFKQLEEVGVTPDWNVKTSDLRNLVTAHCRGQVADGHGAVTGMSHDQSHGQSRLRRDGTGQKEERGSVAYATGVPPSGSVDPSKVLFDAGVALLTRTGLSERQARSLIGKWRKSKGEAWTREALIGAEDKADPASWIEAKAKASLAVEDEAAAIRRATAERYRRMDMPGPPPEVQIEETA